MNYVLLIHESEALYANATPAQFEAMMQAYGKYTKDIDATKRAGDCAALEATPTATSVRIRDGERQVQDGPFAETREQLGGYYTIDAASEEEAIAWASRIPGAKTGTIEVRPIFPTPKADRPKDEAPEGQRQYLLLIYEPEAAFRALPVADQEEHFLGYRAFRRALVEKGQFIAGDRLDATTTAKSVHVDGDARVVRDGPFAETREQLGGYFRVWAKDLDEAIEHAASLPGAKTGTIEVRPVMDTSKYA